VGGVGAEVEVRVRAGAEEKPVRLRDWAGQAGAQHCCAPTRVLAMRLLGGVKAPASEGGRYKIGKHERWMGLKNAGSEECSRAGLQLSRA
jgi:hypothetical protein